MAEPLRLFETYSHLIGQAYVSLTQAPVTAELLRAQIKEHLSQARQVCALYPSQQVESAEFAACACIDSFALSRKWLGVDEWRKNLLQDEYFNTTEAGVLFYDHCQQLTEQDIDLVHLYLFCLASGFRGQYHAADKTELLQQVMHSLLAKLPGLATEVPSLLIQAKLNPVKKTYYQSWYGWVAAPLLGLLLTYGYFYELIFHHVRRFLAAAT